MSVANSLPKVSKKKKIDLNKFVLLAKKVRKSFEEEAKYLENKAGRDGNSYSAGFFPNI